MHQGELGQTRSEASDTRDAKRPHSIPRWAALTLAPLVWLVAIPLAHGVVPWAISLLGPRYGWHDGSRASWNPYGSLMVLIGFIVFCIVIGHAQLAVAEGAIMLGRQGGPFRAPQGNEVTAYVHVTVDDVDKHFERAKQNGARIVQPPHNIPFGERQYTALDHAGHRWTFSQHIADVAPEEWGATSAPN